MQAAWLGVGSLSSFAFSIISAAILSRFLSKSDYGTYKQVMYVYHTLLTVFTLGLPKAYSYFLPRVRINEGNSVVNKLNFCFFVLGAIFSIILYLFAPSIASILNNNELEVNIRIFAPTPLFLLPTMGLEGIMSVYRKTYYGALYMVLTRLFMVICVALPVAFYKSDVQTAVLGFIVSSFISCIIALHIKKIPFKGIAQVSSQLSYKEIFKFSLPLMLASLWGIAIKSADQFYISRWFGSEVFADYSNGALELPFVSMVLNACGTVLLPLFSKSIAEGSNKKQILELWNRTAVKASYLIYPLVVYSWTFAVLIMTFLYGDIYLESAVYFRIILLVNFFTVAQYYPIIVALGETNYYSKVHMYNAFIVWFLELAAVLLFHSPYAIAIVSVICHLIKIYMMISLISRYLEVKIIHIFPVKKLGFVFLNSVVSSIIAYYITYSILTTNNKFSLLIISFSLYLVILIASSKLFGIRYIEIIRPLINIKLWK